MNGITIADLIATRRARISVERSLDMASRIAANSPKLVAKSMRVDISAMDFVGKQLDSTMPVRLPFKDTWVERANKHGAESYIRSGVYLYQAEADEPIYCVSFDMLASDRTTVNCVFDSIVYTNSAGMWESCSPPNGPAVERYADARGVSREEAGVELFASTFAPALLAVALMNCKNVRLEPKPDMSKPPSKKQRRKRTPTLSFNTIVLPGQPAAPSIARGGETEAAWHVVRGHFATYTDEAPAFGKLTGTFWRPAFTRGQKKHGIVQKDYEVR